MRKSLKILSTLIILIPIISFAQESQIYKHPTLDFQFSTTQGWINIPHSEDKLIYEMMSPDSTLHVMLWYSETEQNSKDYLAKMADMKGLSIIDEESLLRNINNQKFWMYNVSGYSGKIPIQTLLAVCSYGKSEIHPKENRLFIIQIWCQKEIYPHKKTIFEEILNSVQIKDK